MAKDTSSKKENKIKKMFSRFIGDLDAKMKKKAENSKCCCGSNNTSGKGGKSCCS